MCDPQCRGCCCGEFASIDEVFFPMGEWGGGKLRPNADWAGTRMWYDFATWSTTRVNSFFKFVVATIHSLDPRIVTHIKYINSAFFGWYAGLSGVNRAYLDTLTNWTGADTVMMPWSTEGVPLAELRGPARNATLLAQYAFDWLTPSMGYAFMRSTTPNKLVVDLEVHASSTSANRNSSIPPRHMGCAMFNAHLHGLSMSLLWEWSRTAAGNHSDGIIDVMSTQPQALAGWATSMAFISAVTDEIHAIATASRPLCMLYSWSSSMHDKDYHFAQVDAFEAASFAGLGFPGFFVEEPSQPTVVPPHCQTLILTGQKFLSDAAVAAVRQHMQCGGSAVTCVPPAWPLPQASQRITESQWQGCAR